MRRIKRLFIPNEDNNFHPLLIRRPFMVAYLLVVLMINTVFAGMLATPVSAAVDAATLYELHNQERERLGLQPLRINTALIDSANAKAEVMLENDCWSHYCPEGTSPWVFFDGAGYNYIFAGENLAEGFRENGTVMTAWMNSPTHRANVVKPEFNEIGIGFATGYFQGVPNNTVVVVHFGSRSNVQAVLPDTGDQWGNDPVSITSPADGSVTSNPEFDVSGTAPAGSTVEIESNDRFIGRVDADGQNFTFRAPQAYPEGLNRIQAEAFDGDVLRGVSGTVHVTVDTIAPVIQQSSVRISSISYGDSEYAIISLRADGDPTVITSNLPGLNFVRAEDIWEGEVLREAFNTVSSMKLVATDLAGNESALELPVAQLLSDVLALETVNPRPEQDGSSAFNAFADSFSSGGTRVQVNILFMTFLFSLFGIDFYVLSKTGMTGIDRGRSHLNLPVLALLILIAIIGGAGGTILTGAAS
ncbi:MAG: Cysteine-rich secretory protein family protein [candidate division WS6 bacterium OLB20]|uniref:Cysteine-rich secretory protein family protein n=1 Tax=candidate division WS6 bacterium OLB20 TaxID=1617426 RepID=A0A136LX60_9BACT|nr:MAG: Cysteine-rich secretory protein family protein [candidate division WS6 bacterium OLB20]